MPASLDSSRSNKKEKQNAMSSIDQICDVCACSCLGFPLVVIVAHNCFFSGLELEPAAWHIPGKHSNPELTPSPRSTVLH
jgi:hypothetical protein